MGFYWEMERRQAGLYKERSTPGIFWILFLFLGFALTCMGLAARSLFADLAQSDFWFDRALVGLWFACLPAYFLTGVFLLTGRKFIRWDEGELVMGRNLGPFIWTQARLPRSQVLAVELVNRKPSPNLAERRHDDKIYYVRGHWRLLVQGPNQRWWVADKHTERGALEGLFEELTRWREKR